MPASPSQPVRLNKLIADSGYCARRKADELIAAGRVAVNGEAVTVLGAKVLPSRDRVTIDGKPLPKAARLYLAFHKPTGVVTSRKAGKQQKSIYELIPPEAQSIDPAGRLDQDSSGLLLLSSDGDFIQRITHPRYHLEKTYLVTTDKALSPEAMQQLKAGVTLQPENKLARMSRLQPEPGAKKTYRVTLITGYNRQIRRSLEALGYQVKTLHRLSFGPVELGNLPSGKTRLLSPEEIRALLSSAPGATPPQQGKKQPENEDGKTQHRRQNKRQGETQRQGQQKSTPARRTKA